MSGSPLLARQRDLLRDLYRAADERARSEPALATAFPAETERTEKEYTEAVAAAEARLADEEARTAAEWETARNGVESRYADEQNAARTNGENERNAVKDDNRAEKDAARAAFKENCWTIEAIFEGARAGAAREARENETQLGQKMEGLQTIGQKARDLLKEWKQPVEEFEAEAREGKPADSPAEPRKVGKILTDAEELFGQLEALTLPRFLSSGRFAGVLVLVWLGLIFPLGWVAAGIVGLNTLLGILVLGVFASLIVTVLGGLVAGALLSASARSSVRQIYQPLCALMREARGRRQAVVDEAEAEARQTIAEARTRHNRELRRAQEEYQQKSAALKAQRARDLAPIEEKLRRRLAESEQRRTADLRTAEERRQARLTEAHRRHADELRHAEETHRRRLEEINATHARQWAALSRSWQEAMDRLRQGALDINRQVAGWFPSWDQGWEGWSPPEAPPPVVPFGSFRVRLDRVPGAVPVDQRLRAMTPEAIDLPALTAFPGAPSLLLEAGEGGRAEAVAALQAVLFRMLTAVPAGKLRSVIVDPVGLGQNFAAFMHLADHDEALVGGRIWTETAHIERQLADLTAHMENVIQKYLRNRFADIAEYNTHAGEVAEPFRVLVVANFPVGFNPEAVRRLVSIVKSGPRCGVFTLISVDTRQPLPEGFSLADLRPTGAHLVWNGQGFTWKDSDFSSYPLTMVAPPPDELARTLLDRVGETARAGRRVEVAFEYIAPTPENWWTGDSRHGLTVPLGRAGATQRQSLVLGQGTAQHALVAGKTGSGKSTLFHALITNLALVYSPDEVELYLVDFKKGVEFKAYATLGLPHARVIAIESEREFGLSVLQRLDAELRTRADRFRSAGAQNLADYRTAQPDAVAPRVLLIVDEFQEFFVDDDRLAQEAAQLLDRLVRQGRAFGVHVILGSQTLGGAYSLARSTIDQMTVRIALQCSEADAQLILSDENAAARLLARPGEAIYNDANGLVEGNHPFQVVWLDDGHREDYLSRVRDLARQRPPRLESAPVVFEGNAPADVSRLDWRKATGEPTLWLGDAMALNDVTSVALRRHNGSNLMMVGQQEEAALGMLSVGLAGLAASGTDSPSFFIVDGRQGPPPTTGVLARLPEVLASPVRLAGSRDAKTVLAEVAAEVDRRSQASEDAGPPVYLVLYGLHRLRDLRRPEDDFGFGRSDEPASAAKQLATILREGPALGVHTLLWSDNLTNLQRCLDRASLREVGLRVVFQMGVADSSNLIDSPAASKLGMHRALFYSEEDGRLEKFRPYGVPPDDWLDRVGQQLRSARRPAEQPAPTR